MCMRDNPIIFKKRCATPKDPQLAVKPFTLRVPLESIVCYSHTFENNMGIKLKGELKAHIHISLYESNTLIE